MSSKDGFIDDEAPLGPAPPPYAPWRALDRNGPDAMDDLLTKIYQQSRSRAPHRMSIEDEDIHELSRIPTANDFPIWRVGCRVRSSYILIENLFMVFFQVGLEEEAVFSLLQRVDEKYRIRSAFARGSIRGWVYLEAHMDTNVVQLLGHTPGIILNRQGVVQQGVDISDWTKLLKMTTPSEIVEPKQWVRVCKGMYKGDIGFLISTESWGVEVLLIPRLQSDNVALAPSSKRKRTKIRPQPALLDKFLLERLYDIKPAEEEQGDYFTLCGLKFEYGLLRKSLDYLSIKSDVLTMPSHNFRLFQFCGHPALDGCKFVRPQEWIFEEGEKVVVRSSGQKGHVVAIATDYLEVDFGGENGASRCPWNDVQKAVEVGDFVVVTSGLHRMQTGFIDWVMDDQVHLVEKQVESSGMVHDDSPAFKV